MPLDRYRAKRDFGKTPEPAPGGGAPAPDGAAPAPGGAAPAPGGKPAEPSAGMPAGFDPSAVPGGVGRFVVHMHRARRLHWDLRLEIDGVLASWAVPKGPTLDPDVRRGAVRTEDHPIEYLAFEGVIPKGEYGAGDSICWDWGTFEPELTWDPGAALRDGELKFRLQGEKLTGRFTIVRTRGDQAAMARDDEASGDAWLLIAKRAGETTAAGDPVAGWDAADHPESVKTGRTSDEVAAGLPPRFEGQTPAPPLSFDVPGSKHAPQPATLAPMLATPGTAPFDSDDWFFEPKWDGYRVLAVVAGGRTRLLTRNGNDAARYFPELASATHPAWLAAAEAIVDGEVVALDAEGRPDFSLLQGRLGAGFGGGDGAGPEARAAGKAAPLAYMVFDLAWCNGRDLTRVPLEQRKTLLRRVLRDHPRVKFGGHVERDGIAFYAAAAERGLEGAMAKHRRSLYKPGRRTDAWLKLKVRPSQELVVAGWLPGEGAARELGALMVGLPDGAGGLRSVGRVGSGFSAATRCRLRARLDASAATASPFTGPHEAPAGVRWVVPFVIRAEIGGWTRDGNVRQAAFVEEADDVDPSAVERQEAVGPAAAERALARTAPRVRAAPTRTPPAPKPTSPAPKPTSPAPKPTSPAPKPTSPAPKPTFAPADASALAVLAALPASGGSLVVGERTLKVTNLDRVLAPERDGEPAVTKRDFIRYMLEIAPVMLPHLADRALNLARYPGGIDADFFWQKDIPKGMPDWVEAWREPDPPDRRPHQYVVAREAATLAWLGNQAAIELHPWTSMIGAPAEPRWALVDIDPGTATTWEETLVLARLYRKALAHFGLAGYPKVTGKRGVQVFIPIRPGYSFVQTRDWVEAISRAVGAVVPELVSWEWAKDARGGRARLDFTQNWRNRTLVGPYSVRPAPGLPVSAPITWDELDDPDLRPDRWTIRTIAARLAAVGDLFAGAMGQGQELPTL